MVTRYELVRLIFPLATVMVSGGFLVSLAYFRAHRVHYPERFQDRMSNVRKRALCPSTAIRAVDLLPIDTFSAFHPLIVAHVLQSRQSREFSSVVVRSLSYPIRFEPRDANARSIVSWHNARELRTCPSSLIKTMRPQRRSPLPNEGEGHKQKQISQCGGSFGSLYSPFRLGYTPAIEC